MRDFMRFILILSVLVLSLFFGCIGEKPAASGNQEGVLQQPSSPSQPAAVTTNNASGGNAAGGVDAGAALLPALELHVTGCEKNQPSYAQANYYIHSLPEGWKTYECNVYMDGNLTLNQTWSDGINSIFNLYEPNHVIGFHSINAVCRSLAYPSQKVNASVGGVFCAVKASDNVPNKSMHFCVDDCGAGMGVSDSCECVDLSSGKANFSIKIDSLKIKSGQSGTLKMRIKNNGNALMAQSKAKVNSGKNTQEIAVGFVYPNQETLVTPTIACPRNASSVTVDLFYLNQMARTVVVCE